MKWFEVRDREWSQQYISDMPWAAISISEDANWPELNPYNLTALLQLKFNHLNCAGDYERAFLFGGLFTLEHARQIIDFTNRNWINVGSFLFQCDDGMCCAPAVAAALMYIKYGPGNEKWYFENKNPSRRVYNTILREYYRRS